MNTPPTPSQTDEARRYINDIKQINTQFGMGTVSSEDNHDAAVSDAAAAFTWTVGVSRAGQRSR